MILSTTWLWLLLSAKAAAKCYSYEGKELDAAPCDATAKISPCCGSDDFCLSNGLCLNAGGNNAFTQQGCTDKYWGFPCRKYCNGNIGRLGEDGDYRYLVQCSGLGYSPMCCGTDYSCCNGTAVLTTIPNFSTVSRAAGVLTSSASTGTATSKTETPAASSSPSSSTPTGSNTPPPDSSKSSADKSVVIGAGVGVPLGVALLAAMGLLLWQTRKRAAAERSLQAGAAHGNTHAGHKQAPTELYSPQPVSELDASQVNRR